MIKDEAVLMERVVKMLPKGIGPEAIESVECDPYDSVGYDGGPSYWVYLNDGYVCPDMGCHTIHEDNLKELKKMVSQVELWPEDPDLKFHRGYTKYEENRND